MNKKQAKSIGFAISLLLLAGALIPVSIAKEQPEIQLELYDLGKNFTVAVANHKVAVDKGAAANPDAIARIHSKTLVKILKSPDFKLAIYQAYLQGEIQVALKKSYAKLLMKGYLDIYKDFKKEHPELNLS